MSYKEHGLTKHGMSKSDEYKIWVGMKSRCFNKNNYCYLKYGGNGVTVCDDWKESFESFYRDMGPRPSKKHSIDRIDNSKGYNKDNCRWATATIQSRNQGRSLKNTSGFRGIHFRQDCNKWSARITVDGKRIVLGVFKEKHEAIKARVNAEKKYWK